VKKIVWSFEQKATRSGYTAIAGIDEAGRGPLAGPVVSAAVILPSRADIAGIDDSKKLSPARRDLLFDRIYRSATAIGLGIVEAAEIDRINILQAALRSMAIAARNLKPQAQYLLIDGSFQIPYRLPQEAITKGDSRSASIAAASIIAKVTRDRMMAVYHRQYPQYGFDRHKGYPTKAHREAIERHGSCPLHRKTFRGVGERA
jgi:ribonuclease HII